MSAARATTAAVACLLASLPSSSRAQQVSADAAPHPEGVGAAVNVPARTGFQLAARTGYAVPFGDATSNAGDSMGNIVSGQASLLLDVGWKFWPRVFLGGYAGLAWGPPAGASGQVCQVQSEGCSIATIRFGLEVTYAFSPSASMDPWVGYALGLEAMDFSYGNDLHVSSTGWEFGHLLAGLDFRLSKVICLGPTIDLSMGQFAELSVTDEGRTSSVSLMHRALHGWLLIGARLVLFP